MMHRGYDVLGDVRPSSSPPLISTTVNATIWTLCTPLLKSISVIKVFKRLDSSFNDQLIGQTDIR